MSADEACTRRQRETDIQRRKRLRSQKRRRMALARGTYVPIFVPIDEARAHIAQLRSHGLSAKAVAALAGLTEHQVKPIAWGAGKQPRHSILRSTSEAVLAVKITHVGVPDGIKVPGCGTSRRIQALAAIGWSQARIAERLGSRLAYVSFLQRNPQARVLAQTARRVAGLYDDLSMTMGPSDSARQHASTNGWAKPLAWDDDEIDDPGAKPRGVPAETSRAERRAAALDAIREGKDIGEAAQIAGVNPETVRRAMRREVAA